MSCRFALPALLLALMGVAAPAQLARTSPAANATVKSTGDIQLVFAAPIKAASAGAQLVMTAMPGMADHPPMAIKAFTIQPGEDGRSFTLKLRKPLVAGDYDVSWSVAGADGKRLSGKWSFKVK